MSPLFLYQSPLYKSGFTLSSSWRLLVFLMAFYRQISFINPLCMGSADLIFVLKFIISARFSEKLLWLFIVCLFLHTFVWLSTRVRSYTFFSKFFFLMHLIPTYIYQNSALYLKGIYNILSYMCIFKFFDIKIYILGKTILSKIIYNVDGDVISF